MNSSDLLPDKKEQTVYIIGDGPSAYLSAIKFKQKGMKNVVIIGTRFDAFTRSASFNSAVFDKISKSIAPLEVKPSPLGSRQIKEAERQLIKHARELGVSFIQGKLEGFENRKLKIKDQTKDVIITTSQDDIVLDCTGAMHAVLNNINAKYKENPIFKFTPVENNPYKTYASMRVYFSPDLLNVSNRGSSSDLNPISYALAIEQLRLLGKIMRYLSVIIICNLQNRDC
jgi:hypothetical protein